MNKIKKLGLLLSCVGAVGFSFIATGCAAETVTEYVEHEHTYSSTLSHDETCHYYEATCDHGDEVLTKDKGYHDYAAETVAPTCTEEGYTTYTCETCGYSYVGDKVDALGHKWKTVSGQNVTCESAGWDEYRICTVCGESEQTIKPATDHTYEKIWSYDENSHWHAGNCLHTDLKGSLQPHRFENGKCKDCNVKELLTLSYADVTAYDKSEYGLTDGVKVTGLTSVGDLTSSGEDLGNAITIPATHNSKAVVAVDNGAFAGNTGITSITLPSSVKRLGLGAFDGCTSLSTINLNNVTKIGEQCFAGCTSITTLTLSSAITELPAYLFMGCTSLSSVTINGSLTKIHLQAFYGCTSLTSFTIPNGVEYIGQSAFEKTGLTSISVPESVKGIASQAFRNCASLTTAVISSHVDFAADAWFAGCGALTTLTIPFVGSHADGTADTKTNFGYLFGMKQYEGSTAVVQDGDTYYIPSGLTTVTVTGCQTTRWVSDSNPNDPRVYGTIFADSFKNCNMIQSITFGANVSKIEANAFEGCTALTSATFTTTSGWTAGGNAVTVTDAAANATALTGDNVASVWTRA